MPEFLLSLNGTSWEIQWNVPEIMGKKKTRQMLHSQFWKPNKSQVKQFKRQSSIYISVSLQDTKIKLFPKNPKRENPKYPLKDLISHQQ